VIPLLTFAALAAVGMWVLRGSLRRLSHFRLRGEVLLVVLFLLQAVARGRLLTPLSLRLGWNPVWPWLLATTGVLAVLVWNAAIPGIALGAAGTALNLLVVGINGAMPVSVAAITASAAEVAASGNGFYSVSATRLRLLGDVVPVPSLAKTAPAFLFSVGDVLLMAGVCLVLLVATLPEAES
jgi:hypothetical protein